MKFSSRALFVSGLMLSALALVVAACTDDSENPLGPRLPGAEAPSAPATALSTLRCTVNVLARTMECVAPTPTAGGASADVITVGGRNSPIRLRTTGAFQTISAPGPRDTLALDVRLLNLIPAPQVLGTEDGTTPAADSIRTALQIWTPPGMGTIRAVTADSMVVGSVGKLPYFRFNDVLESGDSTGLRTWKFSVPDGVTTIDFTIYTVAHVRYPNGWTDVTPDSALVGAGATTNVNAQARNAVGEPISPPITWSSSDPAVATVDGAGLVTGVAKGTAYVKASRTVSSETLADSVKIIVNSPPTVQVDSVDAIGNATLRAPAGTLSGTDADGDALTVVPGTVATFAKGQITFNADGSFRYRPKLRFTKEGAETGRDSVYYRVTDGSRVDSAFLVLKVQRQFWYVDGANTGVQDGRDSTAFATLAAAAAAADPGDTIFVAKGSAVGTTSVSLKPGQVVFGNGIGADIITTLNGDSAYVLFCVVPAGGRSVVGRSNAGQAAAIRLSTNNKLFGLRVQSVGTAALAGTDFGTLTMDMSEVVASGGPALHLTRDKAAAPVLAVALDSIRVSNGAGNGVDLRGLAGSLTISAGADSAGLLVVGGTMSLAYGANITNTAGTSVDISGWNGSAITLSGTIDDEGAGIRVKGNSAGTISFTGSHTAITIGNGSGGAVDLAENTGAAVAFTGGGLLIDTRGSDAAGFSARDGGTVTVSGSGNEIRTGTGVALTLNGVTIAGADGVTLDSLFTAGAQHGINVSNVTGTTLRVLGGTIVASAAAVRLANLTGSTGTFLTEFADLDITGIRAISGTSWGTLNVSDVTATTTGGPVLHLTNGAVSGGFTSISGSVTAPQPGVVLDGVTGGFSVGAGTLAANGNPGILVKGGTLSFTWNGTVNQTGNAALLSVIDGHNAGTLTFGGTLSANAGSGLQFANADGTYAFGGTTTLTNGAGIDVLPGSDAATGSDGTFTFGSGTSISSTVDTEAITVLGSTSKFTYSGAFSTTNNAIGIRVEGNKADSVVFNGPSGPSLSKSLSSGTATAISLANNVGATVVFAGGMTLASSTGTAFSATGGGTVQATGENTIGTGTGRAIALDSITSGVSGIVFRSVSTGATATAILVKDLAGTGLWVVGNGTAGTGGTLGGTSQNAVSLTNVSGTVQLDHMTIQATGAGAVGIFTATDGTLQSTGTSVSAAAGPALSLTGWDANATFASVTAAGGGTGVSLTNVNGSITVPAGSISGTSGASFAVAGGDVDATYAGTITHTHTGTPLLSVTAGHTGTLGFSGNLTANAAGPGLQFNNADGIYNINTAGGTSTFNGASPVAISNGSDGTFSFGSGASITNPSGTGFSISASAAKGTFAGTISKSSAGRAVDIDDLQTGGSYTFTTLVASNASQGARVINSEGAVVFSTADFGTAAARHTATPLTLSNNAGNVSFGDLEIYTNNAAALVSTAPASTPGTLSVTTGIVDATNGTAINISHGSTTQPLAVTLTTVNANGGTDGIVLTRTSGTFTVAGTAAANSGGTLQNLSGTGIALTSVASPSFNRVRILNTGSHGVSGTAGVANFSFTNGTIDGSGNTGTEVAGRQESNISFYQNSGGTEQNVTGTVTITGNTLTNALHHGVNLSQHQGAITSLNVSNNTLTSTTSPTTSRGNGILISTTGTASTVSSVTDAAISNNVITGFPGNAGITFNAGNGNTGGPAGSYGTPADSIDITGNRVKGHNALVKMNTQAIAVALNARGTGYFRVTDNGTVADPIANMVGHAVVVSAFGASTMNIRLANNRIAANNELSSQGISMGVDSAAGLPTTAVMNATVSGNVISGTHGSGIFALATRRGTMNVKILNNSVAAPVSGTYGIQALSATSLANTGTICADISGNTTAGGTAAPNTFPGIGLRRQSGAASAPNTFGIVGLSPSPAGTPTVENYMNGKNTSTSGTFGTGGTALASSSSGFTSCSLSF